MDSVDITHTHIHTHTKACNNEEEVMILRRTQGGGVESIGEGREWGRNAISKMFMHEMLKINISVNKI